MSEVCGIAPEEVRARVASGSLFIDYESGRLDSAAFIGRIEELLNTRFTRDEFKAIWGSIFEHPTLIPESFIQKLREKYRIVLLSNTNELHFEFLTEHYPILKHFDAYVLSHEVGAIKPEKPIYETAIAAAQCLPSECFYTDDMPENIEAAKPFGIHAYVFKNFEETQRQLAEVGVVVNY